MFYLRNVPTGPWIGQERDVSPIKTSASHRNILSAVSYLKRIKLDPGAGYWKSKQTLSRAIQALG
jgi:hypothetical protein